MKKAKRLQKALQHLKQANNEIWGIIAENNLDIVSGDLSNKKAKLLAYGLDNIIREIVITENHVTELM